MSFDQNWGFAASFVNLHPLFNFFNFFSKSLLKVASLGFLSFFVKILS